MAMLIGYFDESGTHDQSAVTTIAGYVAKPEVWASVEAQWRQVLEPFAQKGLHTFHMVDCRPQRRECAIA
jgi:hypothetical protein